MAKLRNPGLINTDIVFLSAVSMCRTVSRELLRLTPVAIRELVRLQKGMGDHSWILSTIFFRRFMEAK